MFKSAVTNSTVNLNNITGVRCYSTSGYGGKGIDINTTIAASNLNIVENTISDISGDGWSTLSSDAIVGIRVLSTSISVTGGVNIWNNTVNLFGSIARSGATADKNACLYIQNTSVGNDVRNNIFVNSLENTTGVSTSYAIATDATSSPFAMINNNAYCVSGNEGILGFYNASNITTLAA
ncbi:MAG: hypothetical protein IPN46_12055 [Saprospiraceae bacterium]|nr:hypothetical protein [Saprospiraceae bacterium]